MAGKSRPETGVVLVLGPTQEEDGLVSSEIKGSNGKIVTSTFQSPWPLVKGAFYDVEARDRQNGEGCYLQVLFWRHRSHIIVEIYSNNLPVSRRIGRAVF